MSQTPVTILTGFLGSGKTTLLNRILKEQHGHRIAVIENEFGEAGIDNELLVQDRDEQIIEMNNGCICCGWRQLPWPVALKTRAPIFMPTRWHRCSPESSCSRPMMPRNLSRLSLRPTSA